MSSIRLFRLRIHFSYHYNRYMFLFIEVDAEINSVSTVKLPPALTMKVKFSLRQRPGWRYKIVS